MRAADALGLMLGALRGHRSRSLMLLLAMAIGVVHGCDGCIASHSRAAVKAGASKEECADMLGVTILMGGGPATIWAPRAYAAFCEFHDAAQAEPTA